MRHFKIICLVLFVLFVLINAVASQKRLVIKHPKMKQNDRSKVNEVNEFAEEEDRIDGDDEMAEQDDQDEALVKKTGFARKLKKKV